MKKLSLKRKALDIKFEDAILDKKLLDKINLIELSQQAKILNIESKHLGVNDAKKIPEEEKDKGPQI